MHPISVIELTENEVDAESCHTDRLVYAEKGGRVGGSAAFASHHMVALRKD